MPESILVLLGRVFPIALFVMMNAAVGHTTDRGRSLIEIPFHLSTPGFVTLVVEDLTGHRVRNLISAKWYPAGDNAAWWDGSSDLGRDLEAARHGVYNVPGKTVAPGKYVVRGLVRDEINLRYEFSPYFPGASIGLSPNASGGWLSDHTPPMSAIFVPGADAPGGRPRIYIGSYLAEAGSALSWLDLDGRQVGGRRDIGGVWRGAPFLARDVGPRRIKDTFAYAATVWNGELSLTALTSSGDRSVLQTRLQFRTDFSGSNEADATIRGLAVNDGLIALSLVREGRVIFIDAQKGELAGEVLLDDPRGLAFDLRGNLLALSGQRLVRCEMARNEVGNKFKIVGHQFCAPASSVIFDDPRGLAVTSKGQVLVSNWGNSHQVVVLTPAGDVQTIIGKAGPPRTGAYDHLHMNHPTGLAVDEDDRVWVAEQDFQPKRLSVWSLDGILLREWYGPPQYGGGGMIDAHDPTRYYYNGMEFKLDWSAATSQLISVFYRDDKHRPQRTVPRFGGSMPEMPVRIAGRQYLTNSFNSSPTQGPGAVMIWRLKESVAIPVAAVGRLEDWPELQRDPAVLPVPLGIDTHSKGWQSKITFSWADLNGNGLVEPEEVQLVAKDSGGFGVGVDLSVVAARFAGGGARWTPRFVGDGVPVYNLDSTEILFEGAQPPVSSGGDQIGISEEGWMVMTTPPQPFPPQSVGGGLIGNPLWSYPSPWPGLHASHEAARPERGELIGTTRLLGGFVTPQHGDAGPVWAINGNMGNAYLFTYDGLFVAQLFQDVRQGRTWSPAVRGMKLNDVSLHDEAFWSSISQSPDGAVVIIAGFGSHIVRIDGLETIRRLPPKTMDVTIDELLVSQASILEVERKRQSETKSGDLHVARFHGSVPFPAEWNQAIFVNVDKRGTAANFNSDSKPYDVTTALAVDDKNLYAAYRTGNKALLLNSGLRPEAPFLTGGALDLMLSTDPTAEGHCEKPAAGDIRLVVTRNKGRPFAVLYRAVVRNSNQPVYFTSPIQTVKIDVVEDVSDKVGIVQEGGDYLVAIPLNLIGLNPSSTPSLCGDIGILRGDGDHTIERVYWNNKATALTADVPSEAKFLPQLWGRIVFDQIK